MGSDAGLQIIYGVELLLGQIVHGVGKLLEIAHLAPAAPCTCAPCPIVSPQQVGQGGGLRLGQFLPHLADPAHQGLDLLKEGLALAVQYAVSVLVQPVDAPLLAAPLAIFQDRPDGAQHMEVGVGNAPVFLVRLVYGEVHHHAPADKLLQ